MFLSNATIKEYLENGKISVIGDINLETTGLSLHLGEEILIPKPNQTVDSNAKTNIEYEKVNIKESPYILKPNDFILGATKESVKTDKDIITMIDGRSTYARVGMTIHICAAVVDGLPFNLENSVLEIKNLGNCDIVLHYGERVGTYLFALLSSPIEGEKQTLYQNQNGVTPPRF